MVVARRDRHDGRMKGGVIVFAAIGIAPQVTCVPSLAHICSELGIALQMLVLPP